MKIKAIRPELVILVLALGFSVKIWADPINNWTNPANAHWQDPFWSLGSLPASNQTVNIANDGYKAVNIDSTTFSDFAASLTAGNLNISAPTNSLSTLLLNYTGLYRSFRVLNSCTVGPNGMLLNEYSSLEIDGSSGGAFTIAGTFRQDGGLTVATVPVQILDGVLTATNASMNLGAVTLGQYGTFSAGTVFQDGGSIQASSVVIQRGSYNLMGGTLYALQGTLFGQDGGTYFYHGGGTNYGNVSLGYGGEYRLVSGLCQGNVLTAGQAADFRQDGGTLDMQYIDVGGSTNYPSAPGLLLKNGIVRCGTLNVGDNGTVEQSGGEFFLTNDFHLTGNYFLTSRGILITYADYRLADGNFHAPSIYLGHYAYFDQYDGTNSVAGTLSLSGGIYTIQNGRLETPSTGVGFGATLRQNRGVHRVTGVLSITGNYNLNGGNVVVDGLYLRGALNIQSYFATASFTNLGLVDFGGTLSARADAYLGQARLSTNSLIAFSGTACQVRFNSSSAVAWTPGSLLTISNWDGTVGTRVVFGSDSSGLTPSQLAQIQFVNPAGHTSGYYPAQMLSSGEIVPRARPALQFSRTANNLVLSWTGNYQLLSATNVTGPYAAVSGASSPFTNNLSSPAQFFILQGL
jgi:hypothetical protein